MKSPEELSENKLMTIGGYTTREIVWFSCGVASAVAAKLASEQYPNCEIVYCDTLKYEHSDNARFMKDVEKWTGKEIKIIKSEKFNDIYDVFNRTKWLAGVAGARCTLELKSRVRKAYQEVGDLHIFGLTFDEQKRIDRFERSNQDIELCWILKEAGVTKSDCYNIIRNACIEIPAMYKLGYNNNNCIGCVKGGAGYWNKIRTDFPDTFERMSKMERTLNVAINKSYAGDGKRKRVFLDELPVDAGRFSKNEDIECGVMCINPTLDLTG